MNLQNNKIWDNWCGLIALYRLKEDPIIKNESDLEKSLETTVDLLLEKSYTGSKIVINYLPTCLLMAQSYPTLWNNLKGTQLRDLP